MTEWLFSEYVSLLTENQISDIKSHKGTRYLFAVPVLYDSNKNIFCLFSIFLLVAVKIENMF